MLFVEWHYYVLTRVWL